MLKMRRNYEKQTPMSKGLPDHDLSQELGVISDILDSHPEVYDFESYVWSGVVTYNLVVLARHMLQ
jgi:hypothetical protein